MFYSTGVVSKSYLSLYVMSTVLLITSKSEFIESLLKLNSIIVWLTASIIVIIIKLINALRIISVKSI